MATYFLDTLPGYRSNIPMVAARLMIMDKEGYQRDMTQPAFFQLHRDKKLACLADGSHSPTSMLQTTPIWSATEKLSPDANKSSRPSPMRVPCIIWNRQYRLL